MTRRAVLKICLATCIFWLIVQPCANGRIIYVDTNATGANDGSSWVDAYNCLQDGLADADSSAKPVQIRVAQGIYTPDQGVGITRGNRAAKFQLINGVTLKGGYAGFGEPDPSARDVEVYETIVSGDLNNDDGPDFANYDDNSRWVVTSRGRDETAVLDGLTITGGSAKIAWPEEGVVYSAERSPPLRAARLYIGGGGMCNPRGSPTVQNCTFESNWGGPSGGGMSNSNNSNPTLWNCTFRNNHATYGGGMSNTDSCPTLIDCTFVANDGRRGSGIYNRDGSNLRLTNCVFSGNSVVSHLSYLYAGGGGMYNDNSSPELTDCTFTNNSAERGAGMCNDDSNPTLTNCIFHDNCALQGGGMYNSESDPSVTSCTFNRNSAVSYTNLLASGGAIYNATSSPRLTSCVFRKNVADWGGGMRNHDSSPTLTNCRFSHNCAVNDNSYAGTTKGGGMYNDGNSSPVLSDCTFSINSAEYGGGAMSNEDNSKPALTNCIFTANSAERWYGGGVYNSGSSSPTVINCTFTGNWANSHGGAILNGSRATAMIAGCAFSANSAQHGGGVHSWGSPCVTNCIFSANSAESGGALSNGWGAQLNLSNCTFVGNLASKGNTLACNSPEELVPSTVEIINCILWNGGDEIWDNDGSAITITCSDVQGGWAGEGNIDTDPCFVEPGYWDPDGTPNDPNDDVWVDGDYHLKSQAGRWNPVNRTWVQDDVTSPCIDAGDMNSPIGYEPFPNGGIINMGAYGGTAEASKSYFGEPVCETIVAGDINGDCKVDFLDFAIMSFHWLQDSGP